MKNDVDFKSLVITKAKEIFIKYGYSKTTMNDIAKACFKSKGLIYHHFNSKEEIFKIVMKNEIAEIIAKMKYKIDKLNTPIEKFDRFIFDFVDYISGTTNLYNKIIQDFNYYYIHVKDLIDKIKKDFYIILEEILNEGIKQGNFNIKDVDETKKAIISLLGGVTTSLVPGVENYIFDKPKTETLIKILGRGIIK